jgi:hypothetical protein
VSRPALARAGVLAAAAFLAFGCGSDGSGDESQQLPSELGQNLANQSDAVRAKLEEGDDCAALDEARALRDEAESAIAEGRVPAQLRPELRQRANDLVESISCVRAPPPPPPPPPPTPTDEEEEEDD